MRRAAGFTLMEIMIAVSITAILGAMTIGSFSQLDRASTTSREQAERYAAARVALGRLSREVSMAFLSEHYDHERHRERPTLFQGREDELLFTTLAHERLWKDAKEADQAVVQYTVDADPDHPGEEALFRRAKARIDGEPERGGRKDLVADRVAGFRASYWDAKKKEWVREWNTRSVERTNELPEKVRLELDTKLADGRTERFVTEARVMITRPLDF